MRSQRSCSESNTKGAQNPPFSIPIYKDYALKGIKKGFLNGCALFVSFLRISSNDILRGVFRGSSELLSGSFYSQLNVSESSDLGQQSNSNSQKCQGGSHKVLWGLTHKNYQSSL